MLTLWASAFLRTQLFELPIWLWALHRDGPPLSWRQRLEASFLASMLTHPWVWFIFPSLPALIEEHTGEAHLSWAGMVVLAELFAWGVESWLMWRLGLRRAVAWAFAANALSFGMGMFF